MEATTDWKMGAGHTLQPHSLGISDKCPPPPPHPTQISEFCLGLGGGTNVFYLPRPDYRIFKIPSFTSLGHTHSPVCAPTATFSFSRILGNPLSSRLSRSRAIHKYVFKFPNYALPYILPMRKKNYYYFFGHSRPLPEWGNPESGTEYNLHTILNAIKCKKIGAVFPKIYHFFHEK